MTRIDVDRVTAIIRDVAEEHILPRFRNLGAGDVAYKKGDDPVTIADKEAESALSTRLSGLLKGSKVVGEEHFSANPGILESFFCESPVWIVDPIDGTRNFVKGNTEFGVIVALAEQNQTIAGWIYDPTSTEVITVEKGAGAFYKGKRLKVLSAAPLQNMRSFLGSRLVDAYKKSSVAKGLWPFVERMGVSSHSYPRMVIDGAHFGKNEPQFHARASLYYTTPWDDAAGILTHQEAGGYSAYWDGTPYQPSGMGRGIALTPDKQSWHEFKEWCLNFTDLP